MLETEFGETFVATGEAMNVQPLFTSFTVLRAVMAFFTVANVPSLL